MTIDPVTNKIVKATDLELMRFWLNHYSDIISYPEYRQRCESLGTVVEDKKL